MGRVHVPADLGVDPDPMPQSASIDSSGVVSRLNPLMPSIAGRIMPPMGSRDEALSSGSCDVKCPGSESNESDGPLSSQASPSLDADMDDPALFILGHPSFQSAIGKIEPAVLTLDCSGLASPTSIEVTELTDADLENCPLPLLSSCPLHSPGVPSYVPHVEAAVDGGALGQLAPAGGGGWSPKRGARRWFASMLGVHEAITPARWHSSSKSPQGLSSPGPQAAADVADWSQHESPVILASICLKGLSGRVGGARLIIFRW